jgi:hypothetical protein
MIVIGVDVHKQSITAVAVDEAGRPLGERTVSVGSDELVGWASSLRAYFGRGFLSASRQVIRPQARWSIPM